MRAKLIEIVEKEFNDFKNEMLSQTKEKIFEESFKINFYSEIRNYFNDNTLDEESYAILVFDGQTGLFPGLWNKYLKWDEVSVTNYIDTGWFIKTYVEWFNKESHEC